MLKRSYTTELFGLTVKVGEPLLAGRRVGQSFRAYAANLSGIDVLIGTYNRLNSCDVVLHLQDSPDAMEDVVTSTVNTTLIRDCAFCAFTFAPVAESANRDFYFWVESPDAILGDCVTLFHNVEDGKLIFSQRYSL